MSNPNYIKDTTVTAKSDFATFSKKDLNFLLGTDDVVKYTPAELKQKTVQQLGDELRTELVNNQPKKGTRKMSDGTPAEKKVRVFEPRISLNVACAASKKTNFLKALIAGKTTVERIRETLAVDTVLAAYWGESVDADLTNAASGIRPAVVRAQAAAIRKAAAAEAKANKPVKQRVTVEVEVGEPVAA